MLYVIHDLGMLDLDPSASHIGAVVYGHSHRPTIKKYGGVLYVNPGSAGPRRSATPVSLAVLKLNGDAFSPKMIELRV